MSSNNDFLSGLIVGGLLGSAFALLFAPQSGKKLRRKIANRSEDIIEDLSEYYEAGKDKADKVIKDSKAKAKTVIDSARSLVS